MIGKTISHYKILEKLGEGGMGVVYKAEDTRLNRLVALKFLPRSALGGEKQKARFVHEAQAAAVLNHPNICMVHEIDEVNGQTFIAMAYIPGHTLRHEIDKGTMDFERALDFAIQIGDGLQEAHEKGIVHRDIKSDNIMIDEKSRAVITDFGLAKLAGRTKYTRSGTTVGTLAYMSPEQASGETVDHRTDIWSLGVCLYEMLTGQLPFRGDIAAAAVYSIMNEDPKPLSSIRDGVPSEFENVVRRTLAKTPEDRYASTAELVDALRKLKAGLAETTSTGSSGAKASVAVLPFVNMSADEEQEYFCDGITEEIINNLTHVENLHVAARTSSFAFKGRDEDIREIGRKLNVETLLEGSVRKAGKRIRVTAQLVKVGDGYHLWSESFDRELEDIFAIQDEISLAIVDQLTAKLLGKAKDRLEKRHTPKLEAYNLYLKGRHLLTMRNPNQFPTALEFYRQAVAVQPDYAQAYAEIAQTHLKIERYGVLSAADTLPHAMEAALRAVELNGTLADAHAALAYARYYHWDWDGAEASFRRALELNQNSAYTHHIFGWFLAARGRFDESMAALKRAQELDPLSLIINANVGSIYYFSRQYKRAVDHLRGAVEVKPDFSVAYQWLGRAYEQVGMYEKAVDAHQSALDILGDPESMASLARALALAGNVKDARSLLADLEAVSKQRFVSRYWNAIVHLGLGEHDSAIENLRQAVEEKFDWVTFLNVEPMFDSIRDDDRFIDMLEIVGLK